MFTSIKWPFYTVPTADPDGWIDATVSTHQTFKVDLISLHNRSHIFCSLGLCICNGFIYKPITLTFFKIDIDNSFAYF